MKLRAARWGLLLAGALGCASEGIIVREYVLTSMTAPEASAATETGHAVTLAVGPVVMPPYLRRREIVTRIADNELRASDTQRWGEDLSQGLARVVAEDLEMLIPDLRGRAFAWRDAGAADYRVAIEVDRFEPMPDGTVALTVHWELSRASGTSPFAAHSSAISEQRSGSTTADAVDAMSRAAAQLSRQIAEAIN